MLFRSTHYATVRVSLSMNKDNDDFKEYGEAEKMAERESLIKSEVNAVISGFTYEEFTSDQQKVQDAVLANLQKLFSSDFIVSVGFSEVTAQ